MKRGWSGDLVSQIGRALISASGKTESARTWTPSLEQALHRLGCRYLLSPTVVGRVIDPFLLHHPSLALGFFNWAAQQPGFSHSSFTYQSLFKSLSLSRQFNHLEKLLKQAHHLRLHPSVYSSVVTSLVSGRRTKTALSVLNQSPSMISEIDSETCNSLLALLSSQGQLKSAHQLLDDMLHGGVRLNTLGFGLYIWNFCRSADMGQTLVLIDQVIEADSSGINGSIVALLVIHGLCSESRSLDAMWTLDALRERQFKPDFMAYRTVAEGLRGKGSVDDMDKVLKKKRKLGVAPRDIDYKHFIFALLSNSLLYETKQLVQVIVSGNFPIEDDVFNSIICEISTNDPSSALQFLKFMLEKERFPALSTVIKLSHTISDRDKLDELIGVFHLLSSKEFFKDISSYNVMIKFFCKGGRLREAYQVLKEMKKKGVSPDVSSYNALLEGCCKEDQLRPAMRLWDEMFTNGCNGNTESYSILIQRLVKSGHSGDAYSAFCQMLDKGVLPDEPIYMSLLGGLCKSKDVSSAFEVFNKSVHQDDMHVHNTLGKLILCLCREGLFFHALRMLLDHTCDTRNVDAHVTFLKYVATAKEVPLAIELLKQIHNESPSMLHALHNELVISVSSTPLLDPVLDFVRDLEGIRPCSQHSFSNGNSEQRTMDFHPSGY